MMKRTRESSAKVVHRDIKDITICFRTNEGLREALELMAKTIGRSLSGVIENILRDQLSDRDLYSWGGAERRHFPRKTVSVPAFVSAPAFDAADPHPGVIVDMSLSGLRLSVPKDPDWQMCKDKEGIHLQVLFSLPPATSVSVKCRPCRVAEGLDDIVIGVCLTDCNFKSYQALHMYLEQQAD